MAPSPPGISSELSNIDFASATGVSIPDTMVQKGFDGQDNEDFFSVSSFDLLTDNWNRYFYYRLIIAEVKNDNTSIVKLNNVQLIYNLPIGPQNLNISMPFATQTTVLADGIMVESNGIPLKMVSIQGTTGIVPFRDTEQTSFDTSAISAFAPNIGRVANNVKAAAQSLNPATIAEMVKKKQNIFQNSGYTQFHKLSQFLQYYAFLSKKSKNKNLRLILDLAKDNTTYIVTPKSFSLQRTASSPLEYNYSIQLEAWKRVKLGQGPGFSSDNLKKGIGDNVALFLAQIKRAFRLIAAASEMISAIRADIQRILDIVRSVAVAIKLIAGAIVSLIELPAAILKDIKESFDEVVNSFNSAKTAIADAWNKANNDHWGTKIFANSDNSLIGASGVGSSSSSLAGANSTAEQSSSVSGSVSDSTPSKGDQAQSTGTGGPSGNRIAKAFDEPYVDSNIDFFDAIKVSDLNLSSNIQSKVNQELQRISDLTRLDFETQRNYINEVSNDIANAFGVGSTKLNRIKGYVVSSFPRFNNNINRTQYELLTALREVATVLDALSVTNQQTLSPISQSFNFVGRLAASANMPFEQATGKFAIPVPYGATIQDIARQNLGTPDRATEIIVLNRLLPPYIDEDGAYQDILSNSFKRTFNIELGNDLYINQKIIFSATNISPFSRKIVNIQRITESNWQITVDGTTDLNLLLSDSPQIQYFTKNTVSSRDLIFIPSSTPGINFPDQLKPIPAFSPDSNPLIKIAKLDMLLGSDGDLVIDSKGEIGVAAGLTNILQSLRIKFSTPLDSLNRHPGFGFGVRPGTPISEINLGDINQSIRATILSDSRFKEILNTEISYNNSTLRISGVVSIHGVDGVLPFNFNL